MHAELARRVGGGGDHAALIRTASDHHRLAFERGIEQLFHRHEERVHVEVEVGAFMAVSLGPPAGFPPDPVWMSTLCHSRSIARTASAANRRSPSSASRRAAADARLRGSGGGTRRGRPHRQRGRARVHDRGLRAGTLARSRSANIRRIGDDHVERSIDEAPSPDRRRNESTGARSGGRFAAATRTAASEICRSQKRAPWFREPA